MKSHTKLFLFTTLDMRQSKNLHYTAINSVNALYHIINKINGYTEESNGNRYLTLIPTDENKDTLKKYK